MSTTTPLPLAGKSCLVQGTRVFLWIAVFAWAIGLPASYSTWLRWLEPGVPHLLNRSS